MQAPSNITDLLSLKHISLDDLETVVEEMGIFSMDALMEVRRRPVILRPVIVRPVIPCPVILHTLIRRSVNPHPVICRPVLCRHSPAP